MKKTISTLTFIAFLLISYCSSDDNSDSDHEYGACVTSQNLCYEDIIDYACEDEGETFHSGVDCSSLQYIYECLDNFNNHTGVFVQSPSDCEQLFSKI